MNEVSRLARCLYGILGRGAEGWGKGRKRHGALVAALDACAARTHTSVGIARATRLSM